MVAGGWRGLGIRPRSPTASRAAGRRAIIAAYEAGYTLFDTADIYCHGESERILGEVLKQVSGMRDRVVILTKGGIRPAGDPQPDSPGRYDFSSSHLISACERSLQRLGIETIDIYMLHRPDLPGRAGRGGAGVHATQSRGQGPLLRRQQLPSVPGDGVAGGLSDAAGRAPG